ncbi:osmotically inducible protein C [Endozoicomonas sp. OPT23]|uniref:bifunctional alpha/beta hydrolase/OsmC family protein n=1 Tax=Endozoicomonas sp. OPT23 TaxID=2072845 RepID=UPI00129BFAFE|nr:bifunctional alpha/beta hydrolase/OsmC family protein [Endozoicomonas sp. OPT23]MRI33656.1 osmotically inducible protein C [Endozoicomonas sp. OPT23]
MRTKVHFESHGMTLAGMLETPESNIRCYALFAHCFTCGKDIAAASRIARALTSKGIAVLRFDFTGLGNSDGDFANTNFSSNMQDLLAAADFLRKDYQAPELLIGHSLGGAAVLGVAKGVPEAKAVVTIGAPHQAEHVSHNFSASIDAIEENGEAEVSLGSRKFIIKKQFLDDIAHQQRDISNMKKALLVMHSPLDSTVALSEAEKIYREARHPKSFVSLDDADHLLTQRHDAEYAAEIISSWVTRYLPAEEVYTQTVEKGHVLVEEKNHVFSQHVSSNSHYWLADEPLSAGGNNVGPDPYEHLLAGLGACTAMTLRMYAKHKNLPLDHVSVGLSHRRDYIEDCSDCEDQGEAIEVIERKVTITGDLSDEQRASILRIADRCPVHRTLHKGVKVKTGLM